MAAYCVGRIRVADPAAWERYRDSVGATIAQYGGEVLFRGRQAEIFNGAEAHEQVVALKFGSIEAANRWHDSPEYQALIPIRDKGADVTLVLYEG